MDPDESKRWLESAERDAQKQIVQAQAGVERYQAIADQANEARAKRDREQRHWTKVSAIAACTGVLVALAAILVAVLR
jgi:hypothetical protein